MQNVGSGGGGLNLWAQIKSRQQTQSTAKKAAVGATTKTSSSPSQTSSAETKRKALATKAKSQQLKAIFARVTDKSSKKQQISHRLETLKASKVSSNSQAFSSRLESTGKGSDSELSGFVSSLVASQAVEDQSSEGVSVTKPHTDKVKVSGLSGMQLVTQPAAHVGIDPSDQHIVALLQDVKLPEKDPETGVRPDNWQATVASEITNKLVPEPTIKIRELPAEPQGIRLKQQAINVRNAAVRNAITSLIKTMQFPEDSNELGPLTKPHIQGVGGTGGREEQGSGAAGHYVNSPLASIHQIVNNKAIDHGVVFKEIEKLSNRHGTANLHDGVKGNNFGQFVSGVLQEVASPISINQHARSTCAAAVAQKKLAIESPQKYIELMTNLVSKTPDPNASIKIPRFEEDLADDKSGRSMSSRLIQDAFMSYGMGAQYSPDVKGMDATQSEKVMTALFGACKTIVSKGNEAYIATLDGDDESVEFADPIPCLGEVAQSLQKGIAVPMAISLAGGGGHEILVTHMDTKNIYFDNPWGSQSYMPINDCKKCLRSVTTSPLPAEGQVKPLPQEFRDVAKFKLMSPTRYTFNPDDIDDFASQETSLSEADLSTYLTQKEGLNIKPEFNLDKADLVSILDILEGKAGDSFKTLLPAVTTEEQASCLVFLCKKIDYPTYDTGKCLDLLKREGWGSQSLEGSLTRNVGNTFGLFD